MSFWAAGSEIDFWSAVASTNLSRPIRSSACFTVASSGVRLGNTGLAIGRGTSASLSGSRSASVGLAIGRGISAPPSGGRPARAGLAIGNGISASLSFVAGETRLWSVRSALGSGWCWALISARALRPAEKAMARVRLQTKIRVQIRPRHILATAREGIARRQAGTGTRPRCAEGFVFSPNMLRRRHDPGW